MPRDVRRWTQALAPTLPYLGGDPGRALDPGGGAAGR